MELAGQNCLQQTANFKAAPARGSECHPKHTLCTSEATPAQGTLPDQNLSLEALQTGCPEIRAAKGENSGSGISLVLWASHDTLCHPALEGLG